MRVVDLSNTATVGVEERARLLQNRVRANAETIEQLREERNILMQDHKDLQQRFDAVIEVCMPERVQLSDCSPTQLV